MVGKEGERRTGRGRMGGMEEVSRRSGYDVMRYEFHVFTTIFHLSSFIFPFVLPPHPPETSRRVSETVSHSEVRRHASQDLGRSHQHHHRVAGLCVQRLAISVVSSLLRR